MRVSAAKRLLLVHAHPDDETINNGVTMAKYAALGAQVTLVTCTRGEEGEVLVNELANLASDKDDKLGEHREIELKDCNQLQLVCKLLLLILHLLQLRYILLMPHKLTVWELIHHSHWAQAQD